MSKQTVFSVLDTAASAFGNPFVVPHVGVAVRAFSDQVNSDSPNDISRHPEDFALYELGTYDTTTGVITSYDIPKLVTQAKSLLININ